MGKRSNFDRKERDFYRTPYEAVKPLLPHLIPGQLFAEPCAGDGALIDHLERHGHRCLYKADIEPMRDDIERHDALDADRCIQSFTSQLSDVLQDDGIITNLPWDRKFLHAFIEKYSSRIPCWLLFDADWVHTKQAIPYLPKLKKMVSVGRVKWFPGTKDKSMDNVCWYNFTPNYETNVILTYGRTA